MEAGKTDGPEVTAYLSSVLCPILEKTPVDAIVLGCTHYPFVEPVIRSLAGEKVRIFDGGPGTARELKRRLTEENLLNPSAAHGSVVFENSLSTKIRLCEELLASDPTRPASVL